MSLQEILQSYVNRPYNELLAIAKNNLAEVLPVLESKFDEKETVVKFLVVLLGTCLGADGALTSLEARFASEVLGGALDTAALQNLANNCDDAEARELIDGIADALDDDTKVALCSFCICVMAVDETISRKEIAFIEKLLG